MRAALIFSGYNQRAVIALCRYFKSIDQQFIIVSSGINDLIYLTDYKNNVVLERADDTLTIELFLKISNLYGGELVYCPTSEFLNMFVLENADSFQKIGIATGMPAKESYEKITSKWSSQELLKDLAYIKIIETLEVDKVQIPCVVKPYKNVMLDRVLYPFICYSQESLKKVKEKINKNEYFAQRFITGQSYYFCAYLSRNGSFKGYWQENILQQPNGKSIVLAKVCDNPGLNEDALMNIISKVGYFGPLMIEFIKERNNFYYIEINPRFWGPLQLVNDVNPQILDAYLEEWFGRTVTSFKTNASGFYAWNHGAESQCLKEYPAINKLKNVKRLLLENDVYSKCDTINLSQKY